MTQREKLKDYMELCGINNKEIANTKTYEKSVQWLGKILNGQVEIPSGEYEMIMKAISEARATKLMGDNNEQNVDE